MLASKVDGKNRLTVDRRYRLCQEEMERARWAKDLGQAEEGGWGVDGVWDEVVETDRGPVLVGTACVLPVEPRSPIRSGFPAIWSLVRSVERR